MKKKLRRLGDITQDMENLLTELTQDHDLQHGEILALVRCWLTVHAPQSQETYMDGTHPEYFYGWRNNETK